MPWESKGQRRSGVVGHGDQSTGKKAPSKPTRIPASCLRVTGARTRELHGGYARHPGTVIEPARALPRWCKLPLSMARRGSALLLACLVPAAALDNGVGRTPALGWSSWNYFVSSPPPAPHTPTHPHTHTHTHTYTHLPGRRLAH